MAKTKIEHIDNLARGLKSWAKIGSRWVPHHLYKYEVDKYNRSLKYKYLEVTEKDRVNLRNVWQKICAVKKWENYTLVKNTESWTAKILLNDKEIGHWDSKIMKLTIKSYV